MAEGARSGRVVVVGGGITGAFSAYFLARGGFGATLVERDSIGAGASGKNPGGLNPLYGPGIPGPMEVLSLASFRLHHQHRDEIGRLSGLDFRPRRSRRLHVAADEEDLERLERLRSGYEDAAGFSADWLSAEQILAREPRLDPGGRPGLLTSGDAKVDAPTYTRAVARSAVALGAAWVEDEVRGLRHDGGRVSGVLLGSGELRCDGVVIATGPWCEGPAAWLATPIPVCPVRGEMVHVELPGGGLAVDVARGDTALYDAGDGKIQLGGTEERAGFDSAPTDAARTSILERAGAVMPAVASATVIGQTAALRPVTPDGAPLAGIPSGWENVCLALGGGRKGFLQSAALGRAAADLLTSGSTSLPIAACDPDRGTAAALPREALR